MHTQTSNYEQILDYLKAKYKRVTIGKKELSNELGIGISTLDLYMSKSMGLPRYKKLGDKPNSRVVFTIVDVAVYLSSDQIETM